jgi:tetratricopeptide (TPR) repeat protein
VAAVVENPRIEELRRRVQKDKASIAFAQLAEEYRRAGRFQEAIDTCTTGLSHHPGYLSAHVTLGRALIETGDLQAAQDELTGVLSAAPDNLAAIKGLAEIHHRRGALHEALEHYRRALEFAPHDPELEHVISQLTRDVEPGPAARDVPGGLSFEEAIGEFIAFSDKQAPPAEDSAAPLDAQPDARGADAVAPERAAPEVPAAPAAVEAKPAPDVAPDPPAATPVPPPPAEADQPPAASSPQRAFMQVEALERWLDAILAGRDQRE